MWWWHGRFGGGSSGGGGRRWQRSVRCLLGTGTARCLGAGQQRQQANAPLQCRGHPPCCMSYRLCLRSPSNSTPLQGGGPRRRQQTSTGKAEVQPHTLLPCPYWLCPLEWYCKALDVARPCRTLLRAACDVTRGIGGVLRMSWANVLLMSVRCPRMWHSLDVVRCLPHVCRCLPEFPSNP
jgi:hypothetical protein